MNIRTPDVTQLGAVKARSYHSMAKGLRDIAERNASPGEKALISSAATEFERLAAILERTFYPPPFKADTATQSNDGPVRGNNRAVDVNAGLQKR